MDNMPTTTTTTNNNTTPQASIAGEGDDDDDKNFCIQIKTFHLDCVGVVVGPESQEVDENFLCEKQDRNCWVNLAKLSSETLNKSIEEVIRRTGDDHGRAETGKKYTTFEYVYDEEGRAARSLEELSDEDLREIIANNNGFVNVEWVWL